MKTQIGKDSLRVDQPCGIVGQKKADLLGAMDCAIVQHALRSRGGVAQFLKGVAQGSDGDGRAWCHASGLKRRKKTGPGRD
ncbi:MAG: hypothetical protein HWE39_12430 [Oceanospirillaceae bacterium]|uniref:hypothetical protein n=1 Tax=Salipiger sp. HF18 TaxID=2721557 RepID=UPI00142DACBD|nr:hypothetical protein [Salipiger sp. HF18]NIY96575.1 hypothetical protein [Salipiger sp. HF18]NVK42043.1 hypothetical protein [Oceanospirillaceae bacterium]